MYIWTLCWRQTKSRSSGVKSGVTGSNPSRIICVHSRMHNLRTKPAVSSNQGKCLTGLVLWFGVITAIAPLLQLFYLKSFIRVVVRLLLHWEVSCFSGEITGLKPILSILFMKSHFFSWRQTFSAQSYSRPIQVNWSLVKMDSTGRI